MRARASAAPDLEASATSTSDLPASAAARASSAAPRATVRMVPSTGRITASRASWSAMVRASGELAGTAGRAAEPVEALGDAPEQLGQDDSGIAAGTHQGAVGDGPAGGVQVRRLEGVELFGDRFEGQRHVGAGVAVGHRVDVEAVDDILV